MTDTVASTKRGDVPFAVGALYGMRSFQVYPTPGVDGLMGRIPGVDTVGLTPRQISLNLLERGRPPYPVLAGPARTSYTYGPGVNEASCIDHQRARSQDPPHPVATKGCSCGFYAFYDGQNSYASPYRLTALVKGYGRVVYGSQGFRAAKLEIVAAVNPHLGTHEERQKDLVARKPKNYIGQFDLELQAKTLRDHVDRRQSRLWRVPRVTVGVGALIILLLFARLLLWPSAPWWGVWAPIALEFVFIASLYRASVWRSRTQNHIRNWRISREWDAAYTALRNAALGNGDGHQLSLEVYRRLEANYPGIKWYPTVSAMLKEHPMSVYLDLPGAKDPDQAWSAFG